MSGPTDPTFLVIGAMKCATTTLCHLLSQHPDVVVSDDKEPEFFCRDDRYARGMDWYRTLFAGSEEAAARGEGSTSYTKRTYFPRTAERIVRAIPRARLIYIVRHPLARIESHWMHNVARGRTCKTDFNGTVRETSGLVESSLYHWQLSIYRDLFPEDQIRVLFYEDFITDRQGVLRSCFEFLGVDPLAGRMDQDTALNQSVGRTYDGTLLRLLRHSSMSRISGLVPPPLRRSIGTLLQREMAERPRWDDATRESVLSRVLPDAQAFLAENGKPTDFWDLQPSSRMPQPSLENS